MWFRSSTQPISISRSPFRQSRPVVSVSKTISRMIRLLVPFAAEVQGRRARAPQEVQTRQAARRAPAGSRRPARSAASSPRPESTRKCARRRFSASGIWRARSAANFASVMPGRARTRARWISGSAVTTTIDVDALRRAGLEEKRHVDHDEAAPLRPSPAPGTPPRSRAPADARSPRAARALADRRRRARQAARGRSRRRRSRRETPLRSARPPRPR